MHKTLCRIGEETFCISRSSVKFQGHRGQRNHQFDPGWAFPDWNSSFTRVFEMMHKLDVAKKRCPIIIQGHPSNLKATRITKSTILTRIALMHTAWRSIKQMYYCFPKSSAKLKGHTGRKFDDLNPSWVRLLGRSQLPNPLDLPCSENISIVKNCNSL